MPTATKISPLFLSTTPAISIESTGSLKFNDSGSNYVGFQSPTTVTSSVIWVLPDSDGTTGQILSSDGSGTLSWIDPGATVAVSDTAPSGPENGDLWWKSDEGRLYIYYEDGSSNQWVDALPQGGNSGSATTVSTGDAAPSNPQDGDLWWKSDEAKLYIYYQDANSSQWVETAPPVVLNGAFSANDGSATQPAIHFTSDADTGIWRPGDNTIAISTAGSERIRIDPTGKIGVGADPTLYPGKFVVSGDALICDRDIHSRVASSIANSDRGFKQDTDGVEKLHLYTDNDNNIILEGNGGSEKIRINNNGYFGINNEDPLTWLHVDGSGTTPCLLLADSTNPRFATGLGNTNVSNVGQRLDFYTGDSGSNTANLTSSHIKMSLTAQGRLGIGTVDPATLLDVRGEATFGEGLQEGDFGWGPDVYQRLYFFSGTSGGATTDQADGCIALVNPNTNPTGMRIGSIVFGNVVTSGAGYNHGIKAVIESNTNTPNAPNASTTGANIRFLTKPDSGALAERMKISSEGYVTAPSQPAFFAHIVGTDTTVNNGTIIVWNSTRFNRGNHYSTSTGKFTAPVAGVYCFQAQIWGKNGSLHSRARFYKNGGARSQNGYHSASVSNSVDHAYEMTLIEDMQVGDTMDIRPDYYNLTFYAGNANEAHSYFTGFLVS